jgi:hypothetical protein
MSSPPLSNPLDVPADVDIKTLRRLVTGPVKRLAFWAAIALPFLHLPLLATGLDSQTTALAFGALVACNVLALFIGHYHDYE